MPATPNRPGESERGRRQASQDRQIDYDRGRATRSGQMYLDRLTEANLVELVLNRRKPNSPRGLVFRDGVLQWEEPKETRNVHYYNVYVNFDDQPVLRVPVGQTKSPTLRRGAQRAWVSAVNDRNGLESNKVYCEVRITPPEKVELAAHPKPGAVTFTPVLRNHFGFIGITDVVTEKLVDDLTELHVAFWYVDEPEGALNYAKISGDPMPAPTPVTEPDVPVELTPELPAGHGGDVDWFKDGDYVLVDDRGTEEIGSQYEIVKIKIDPDAPSVWVIPRENRGQFGSPAVAHAEDIRMYRLDLETFDPAVGKDVAGAQEDGLPKTYWHLLPAACVVAVQAQLRNDAGLGPITTVNLSEDYPPGDVHHDNINPGLRTLSDILHNLPLFGAGVIGMTMANRLYLRSDMSYGTITCTAGITPQGTAEFEGLLETVADVAAAGYILYIGRKIKDVPNSSRPVGVIDQWAILEDAATSVRATEDSFPYQRRSPYPTRSWPYATALKVGTLGTLFNEETGTLLDGALPFELVLDEDENPVEIPLQEGGELDAVVAQVGEDRTGSQFTPSIQQ